MDDDILSKVVEVEKEVQQRIGIEKKMSQEWLENVKKDAEEKILRGKKELEESLNASIREAKLNAETKAVAIIKDADDKAERLKGLDDNILKKVILKHISRILPG